MRKRDARAGLLLGKYSQRYRYYSSRRGLVPHHSIIFIPLGFIGLQRRTGRILSGKKMLDLFEPDAKSMAFCHDFPHGKENPQSQSCSLLILKRKK
jgi:hypothetical protein